MNPAPPTPRLWRNVLLLIPGGILLFWLPLESSDPKVVLMLSVMISAASSFRYLLKRNMLQNLHAYQYIVAGMAAGLLVTPIAVGLMIIKTGIHAHLVPEYSNRQMLWVVGKTPLITLGGALIGIGAALRWGTAKQTDG